MRNITGLAKIAGVAAIFLVSALVGSLLVRGILQLATRDHPLVGSAPSISVSEPAGCQAGQVPVNLRLPDKESDINVDVFNATDVQGLAALVAGDLRNRGFTVRRVDSQQIPPRAEVAIIRYGPRTVGAAHLLNAYTLNGAVMEFDLKRTADTVDLVVGGRFSQLATPTEMRQAVAIAGWPKLPPGTCAQPD